MFYVQNVFYEEFISCWVSNYFEMNVMKCDETKQKIKNYRKVLFMVLKVSISTNYQQCIVDSINEKRTGKETINDGVSPNQQIFVHRGYNFIYITFSYEKSPGRKLRSLVVNVLLAFLQRNSFIGYIYAHISKAQHITHFPCYNNIIATYL